MGPATFARITGATYLLYFLTAIGGALLAPGVSGPGTLAPDAFSGSTYQLGVALGLVSTCLYLAVVGLLYRLFLPVNGTVALLALVFGVMGCAVTAFGTVLQHAPLVVASADPELALVFLKVNAQALHVALVFFGTFQLFLGYLIYRSNFLPRLIGVLIAVAGVGWLTALGPGLPALLAIVVALLGAVAEGALMLWLLVFGVRQTSSVT
jgi:hypothetical protein